MVDGDQWDLNKLGLYSVAFGNNVVASGEHSAALGFSAQATGTSAFAVGSQATASATNAIAIGNLTKATQDMSVAIGSTSEASHNYAVAVGGGKAGGYQSIAIGRETKTFEQRSVAIGYRAQAQDQYATALGYETVAAAFNATAMGYQTQALGNYSTAMGNSTVAETVASMAIGRFNTIRGGSPNTWNPSDPLFVAGNGSSSASRSDALVLYKNGNLQIAGTLSQSSDARLKEEIEPFEGVLDRVLQLQPVTYRFKEGTNRSREKQIGLLAQEVAELFPELVKTEGDGYLTLSYTQLTAVLLQALREQQERYEAELAARDQAYEARVSVLERRLAELERRLAEPSAVAVEASNPHSGLPERAQIETERRWCADDHPSIAHRDLTPHGVVARCRGDHTAFRGMGELLPRDRADEDRWRGRGERARRAAEGDGRSSRAARRPPAAGDVRTRGGVEALERDVPDRAGPGRVRPPGGGRAGAA